MKNQYIGGNCLKVCGDWTVYRFKKGLGKKEEGGCLWGGEEVIPQCTVCYFYKFKGRPNTASTFFNPMMNFKIKKMLRTCIFKN